MKFKECKCGCLITDNSIVDNKCNGCYLDSKREKEVSVSEYVYKGKS